MVRFGFDSGAAALEVAHVSGDWRLRRSVDRRKRRERRERRNSVADQIDEDAIAGIRIRGGWYRVWSFTHEVRV